jgi:hypothetical protein
MSMCFVCNHMRLTVTLEGVVMTFPFSVYSQLPYSSRK